MMDLRQRARELAHMTTQCGPDGSALLTVEQALLQFAREALTEQPDAKMLDSGVAFALNVTISGDYKWTQYVGDMWQRMSARRAAHLSADEAGEGR